MKIITSNYKQIEDTTIFENEELQSELSKLLGRAKEYSEKNIDSDISDEEF